MRRVLVLGLLCALAVAGCGSSSSAKSANPVNTELSYFPANSPFVMSIVTDPNSSAVAGAHSLVDHFPIASFGESALMQKLSQDGIDYQNDIRPLFGNPVMFGLTETGLSTGSGAGGFLAVWVTKDGSKLASLIKKLGGFHSAGSHDGATLYQAGGSTTFAVNSATLVIGPSPGVVDAALDRHAHGGGITSSQYAQALAGLPQNSLVEAFGNLAGVLSRPSAAKARQVPWVDALRSYATTISANSSGLTFQFRVNTTGRQLTQAEVPLAPATAPPSLAGELPIAAGIEDPAHIVAFGEAAQQASSPASYAKFQRRQAAIRAKTGVDLNSLLKLATGSLMISSNTHATMGRVGLSNPAAAASALSKLMAQPRSVFNAASGVHRLGGGFYSIREAHQTITVGVVGSQLLVGKATPAQLRSFAAAPTAQATGAKGSVAFQIALIQLLKITLKNTLPSEAQGALAALGNITGWAAASPSALTGSATLAIH
jgi:Protein of unknown function (DUF3352)